MAWIQCILDKYPVGNLTLIDDSGFSYSATVQTDKANEVNNFIAVANKELLAVKLVKDSADQAAASILLQAQGS